VGPITADIQRDRVERVRSHIRQHVQSVGGAALIVGLEVATLIRMVANLYEAIGTYHLGASGLSAARWRLLLHLFAEEQRGNTGGVTPTHLSRCEDVSKNTISALLRGLEEQGLIQRALDPTDRRLFRIQLSAAGRELVASTAPQRIAHLNGLLADLTPGEQAQLVDLLARLYRSLLAHSGLPEGRLEGRSGEGYSP